ncbi:MAG TPA: hypothetical protein DEP66_01080, partial [Acidimicrobiaceae bacterium]|nr:hypothetical protein [Acidimicrobiaceae bacterium]
TTAAHAAALRMRPPLWPGFVAAAAGAAAALLTSPPLGVAAAVVVGVSLMCFATVPFSSRSVAAAESTARFAAVLANQATVSRTVTEALARAAPLIDGPVGVAARALVDDCRSIGVEAAAQRFAERVATPAASWLADVIGIAAAGGGQWAPIMAVLETEAAEVATTARHFHRHVAATLNQLGVATLLGAGIVVGAALLNPESWTWLTAGDGAGIALAMAAVAALTSWKLLSGAWEVLR